MQKILYFHISFSSLIPLPPPKPKPLRILFVSALTLFPSEPSHILSSVQLLSRVRLFAAPWIAAHQASLFITNSRSSLKLTPIESVMPSSHLILCRPLLLLPPIPPSIRVFSNESTLSWGGQSTGVSASASFLPKNTQDWSHILALYQIYMKGLTTMSCSWCFSKYDISFT